MLSRSRDVAQKIDEICKAYEAEVQDDSKDIADALSGPAIKELEKQNKRQVNQRKRELTTFVVQIVKNLYMESLKQNADIQNSLTPKLAIAGIDNISKCEAMLRYNVSTRIFCDALFLTMTKA